MLSIFPKDILFDATSHKVKKFILHTNLPGHYNFNMWVYGGLPLSPIISLPPPLSSFLFPSSTLSSPSVSPSHFWHPPSPSYYHCNFTINFPLDHQQQQTTGSSELSVTPSTKVCLWLYAYLNSMTVCMHAHTHMHTHHTHAHTVEWGAGILDSPNWQARGSKQILFHQQHQPFWQHLLLRLPKCYLWGKARVWALDS